MYGLLVGVSTQPNESVGRYEITRLISLGGMAAVHHAVMGGHAGFQKQLAIKVLYNHYAEQPEVVQLFEDEARLGANLHHPAIVQVFDFGVEVDKHYMAMEYIDGWDLAGVLKAAQKVGHHLSVDAVLFIGARIADALSYAHEVRLDGARLGVIHRDLSPWNVLVSVEGDVKVADFGLAKFNGRNVKTEPGHVRGRYSYMAPEQAMSKDIDGRADLFSLGVVLYEMLVGCHPFQGSTAFQVISKTMNGAFRSVAEKRPDIPRELTSLIDQLLAPEARDRPATARQVRLTLGRLLLTRGRVEEPGCLYEELAILRRHRALTRPGRKEGEESDSTDMRTMELRPAELDQTELTADDTDDDTVAYDSTAAVRPVSSSPSLRPRRRTSSRRAQRRRRELIRAAVLGLAIGVLLVVGVIGGMLGREYLNQRADSPSAGVADAAPAVQQGEAIDAARAATLERAAPEEPDPPVVEGFAAQGEPAVQPPEPEVRRAEPDPEVRRAEPGPEVRRAEPETLAHRAEAAPRRSEPVAPKREPVAQRPAPPPRATARPQPVRRPDPAPATTRRAESKPAVKAAASTTSVGAQRVLVVTDPPGATVVVSGSPIGKAPITVPVEALTLVGVKMDGYLTANRILRPGGTDRVSVTLTPAP